MVAVMIVVLRRRTAKLVLSTALLVPTSRIFMVHISTSDGPIIIFSPLAITAVITALMVLAAMVRH